VEGASSGGGHGRPQPPDGVRQGDFLELGRTWPDGFVDLIFADPPYNIGYQYDEYDDRRAEDDYVAWTQRWVGECARILSPNGSMFILIGDEYAAETRVHLKQLERERALRFRNWIVWHYTFGQSCKLKFSRSHAHLFYCVGSAACARSETSLTGKGRRLPFTFNRDAIAVPSARQLVYNDTRANPKGKVPDDTWYLRPQETMGTMFRPDEDTWYLSRLCGTFNERQRWHPCQLPESLLERIIGFASNPGDPVLDPFVGSGTTLTVARREGRRWLGCELSAEYAARATERIEAAEVRREREAG
jgi:site-specific DNA-methyltransferase (adenine-specific)